MRLPLFQEGRQKKDFFFALCVGKDDRDKHMGCESPPVLYILYMQRYNKMMKC